MPNKTLRDIAIEIGINVNTLKSRIYRAACQRKENQLDARYDPRADDG